MPEVHVSVTPKGLEHLDKLGGSTTYPNWDLGFSESIDFFVLDITNFSSWMDIPSLVEVVHNELEGSTKDQILKRLYRLIDLGYLRTGRPEYQFEQDPGEEEGGRFVELPGDLEDLGPPWKTGKN